MTSATTTPISGARRKRNGYGLVLYAALLLLLLLLLVGAFNLIDGIAAVANSHVFVANAHYVFANLRTWGWITLVLGALQLLAAVGVLAGN